MKPFYPHHNILPFQCLFENINETFELPLTVENEFFGFWHECISKYITFNHSGASAFSWNFQNVFIQN